MTAPATVAVAGKGVAWKLHAIYQGLALPDAAQLAYGIEEINKEKLERFEFLPINPKSSWRSSTLPNL